MCGPLTGMMPSIGTIVTLSENVLLLVLRYASSHDPVRTFFEKMRVIPKVMPQIVEELLPLLKCCTIGEVIKAFLRTSKASLQSSSNTKGTSFWRRLVRGLEVLEKSLINFLWKPV